MRLPSIETYAPPGLRAAIDALRFEQVVRNLLDNAVKFGPNGGRIEVELATVSECVAKGDGAARA